MQGEMDAARAAACVVEGNVAAHAAELAACQEDLIKLQTEAKAAQQAADQVWPPLHFCLMLLQLSTIACCEPCLNNVSKLSTCQLKSSTTHLALLLLAQHRFAYLPHRPTAPYQAPTSSITLNHTRSVWPELHMQPR